MALFRRKKIETPRSALGLALYQYDNILKKNLKKILDGIDTKKKINAGKTGVIVEDAKNKFDDILNDLSREKLKVDYRSDKIRYLIIDMINKLKKILEKAEGYNFDPSRVEKVNDFPRIGEIMEIRDVIKGKMKDIESDYF